MGGFGVLHAADIAESQRLLARYFLNRTPSKGKDALCDAATANRRALDCGCGTGRISATLLAPHFAQIDLVEPNDAFLRKAAADVTAANGARVGRCFEMGLQAFCRLAKADVDEHAYDVIWIQWVLLYLKDGKFSGADTFFNTLILFWEICRRRSGISAAMCAVTAAYRRHFCKRKCATNCRNRKRNGDVAV